MNVKQWIEYCSKSMASSDLYFGHGTDNATDEAAWLVLHVLDAEHDSQFEDWQLELDHEQASRVLQNLANRIENRTPLAYIHGSAWFAGLEFEVNPSVLVPRSPISQLIQEQFLPWFTSSENAQALDLCTGCGCIGIAMAVHMPWLRVDAADISPAALSVARRNVKRHAVESRVTIYQSDLFAELNNNRYDLIVTNPPYVASAVMQNLPGEYLEEPELGLVSGVDGLDACLQIMSQSPDYLHENGFLICEVGESEHQLVKLLPMLPFLWLEFEHGGSGVFLLSRNELVQSQQAIGQVIEDRTHVT